MRNGKKGSEGGVIRWNSPQRREILKGKTCCLTLNTSCWRSFVGYLDVMWRGPEGAEIIQEPKLDFCSLDDNRVDTENLCHTFPVSGVWYSLAKVTTCNSDC